MGERTTTEHGRPRPAAPPAGERGHTNADPAGTDTVASEMRPYQRWAIPSPKRIVNTARFHIMFAGLACKGEAIPGVSAPSKEVGE
jgi:hypothetical protein